MAGVQVPYPNPYGPRVVLQPFLPMAGPVPGGLIQFHPGQARFPWHCSPLPYTAPASAELGRTGMPGTSTLLRRTDLDKAQYKNCPVQSAVLPLAEIREKSAAPTSAAEISVQELLAPQGTIAREQQLHAVKDEVQSQEQDSLIHCPAARQLAREAILKRMQKGEAARRRAALREEVLAGSWGPPFDSPTRALHPRHGDEGRSGMWITLPEIVEKVFPDSNLPTVGGAEEQPLLPSLAARPITSATLAAFVAASAAAPQAAQSDGPTASSGAAPAAQPSEPAPAEAVTDPVEPAVADTAEELRISKDLSDGQGAAAKILEGFFGLSGRVDNIDGHLAELKASFHEEVQKLQEAAQSQLVETARMRSLLEQFTKLKPETESNKESVVATSVEVTRCRRESPALDEDGDPALDNGELSKAELLEMIARLQAELMDLRKAEGSPAV